MAKLTNIPLVESMVNQGYISVQKHPSCDLYCYNYTAACAVEGMWNEATSQCRGVVTDAEYNILSRPFAKFFNYEEIADKSVIPQGAATAYDKLDGSLGIVYWIGDTPYICTRGSFVSDQALHATETLHRKYRGAWSRLAGLRDRGYTVLFEIIYPENRVVVDYGDMDDIVLIAIVSNERDGDEIDIGEYRDVFPTARCFGRWEGWTGIRSIIDGRNREGFVLVFEDGFRMKMKYEDYFRLHRLKNYLTKKRIFEYLETGRRDELAVLVNQLDEEVRLSVAKITGEYDARFNRILDEAKAEYRDFETDKEAAAYFRTCKQAPVLFALRKGQPVDGIVWRLVKRGLKEESGQ